VNKQELLDKRYADEGHISHEQFKFGKLSMGRISPTKSSSGHPSNLDLDNYLNKSERAPSPSLSSKKKKGRGATDSQLRRAREKKLLEYYQELV
jgi:hypothetical protein